MTTMLTIIIMITSAMLIGGTKIILSLVEEKKNQKQLNLLKRSSLKFNSDKQHQLVTSRRNMNIQTIA